MSELYKDQEGMFGNRFLITLGVVIFLVLAAGYFFYGLQPSMNFEGKKKIRIEEGQSFRQIGAELSQASLVRSIFVFKLYSVLTGRATRFKPGIYYFSSSMSVSQITSRLTEGGKQQVIVTIPEGLTVRDTDKLLANSKVIKEGQLINYSWKNGLQDKYRFLKSVNSLEGFLFPDTYKFEINSKPKEVLEKFLDNFKEESWSKLKKSTRWYDKLILASFLEKEVEKREDKRVVAGVLLNRLDKGMPLQVDATLSYVKCNRQYLECENPKPDGSDTEIASPYNTYKRQGWPPTPISNPGIESIEAALNPKDTSYLYYLSDKDTDKTIFSENLKEHKINIKNHL
ncbi:MAG: endolytic transglycosylase MltG [Candidatus Magasanikbacteria bacterium]